VSSPYTPYDLWNLLAQVWIPDSRVYHKEHNCPYVLFIEGLSEDHRFYLRADPDCVLDLRMSIAVRPDMLLPKLATIYPYSTSHTMSHKHTIKAVYTHYRYS